MLMCSFGPLIWVATSGLESAGTSAQARPKRRKGGKRERWDPRNRNKTPRFQGLALCGTPTRSGQYSGTGGWGEARRGEKESERGDDRSAAKGLRAAHPGIRPQSMTEMYLYSQQLVLGALSSQ